MNETERAALPQEAKDEMLRVALWEALYGCGSHADGAVHRWLRAGAELRIPPAQKAIGWG